MAVDPPDDATRQPDEGLPEAVRMLHGELLRLSGRYGVSLQKLQTADALSEAAGRALRVSGGRRAPGSSDQTAGAGADAASPSPQAVQDWLAEVVGSWPSEVDGEILSRGLGLAGPASVGSRQERLALLAAEYNRLNQPGVGEAGASGSGLDHLFTDRLLVELAWRVDELALRPGGSRQGGPADVGESSEPAVEAPETVGTDGQAGSGDQLASIRPEPDGVGVANDQSQGRRWVWAGAGGLVAVIGVVTLLWLVSQGDEDALGPSFRVVPESCSIDVCNSEATAFRGESSGFEPGEVVRVTIVTPSGVDANELGGVYGYRNELVVDEDGAFLFQYWWDPGMEVGGYLVEVESGDGMSFTSFEMLGNS